MKHSILKTMQKVILFVAMISIMTPSQATFYEPQVPQKLRDLKL